MKINDLHDNVIFAGDDKDAVFRLLFDEHYKKLCIYVFNLTADDDLSEDIVAEAFVSLWENFYSIRNRSAMKSWLYQVCRNKSFNSIKSVKHRQKKETDFSSLQPGTANDITTGIIHAELLAELHMLIRALPAQCSRIFTKLYIEGKGMKETARELQLSINTIKSQKNRGLQLLRLKLKPGISSLSILFLQICLLL